MQRLETESKGGVNVLNIYKLNKIERPNNHLFIKPLSPQLIYCNFVVEIVPEGADASSDLFITKTNDGGLNRAADSKNIFMIDKQLLRQTVDEAIAGTALFVVDIAVEPGNRIVVELDSPTAVDIDSCVAVTRKIESVFDRDVEDYELEVGSAGLTSPLRVKAQYDKNIGNQVEVLTRDGRKLKGTLVAATDDGFTIETPVKVKPEGAKRPVIEMQPQTFDYGDCKSVRYVIDFK